MIKSTSNYPVEVLKKSKAVLESNIRGVPGMFVSADTIISYQKRVREVTKAIEYLELMEASKKRRKEAGMLK